MFRREISCMVFRTVWFSVLVVLVESVRNGVSGLAFVCLLGDYAKMSGDELVRLFQTFENGVPRHLWQELRSVLKGRRLTFTNQWILGGGAAMSTKGLTLRFGWRPPGSENTVRRPDGSYSYDDGGNYAFSVQMPWEVLDACSRIPVQGDGIRRVSGTVSDTERPFGPESILQLEDVSVRT